MGRIVPYSILWKIKNVWNHQPAKNRSIVTETWVIGRWSSFFPWQPYPKVYSGHSHIILVNILSTFLVEPQKNVLVYPQFQTHRNPSCWWSPFIFDYPMASPIETRTSCCAVADSVSALMAWMVYWCIIVVQILVYYAPISLCTCRCHIYIYIYTRINW